ncbi:hypothetical protein HERIO_512 [Hepatospora eriocheir]|uniref:Uncharacterized protein n=1 Tax=Hepatospora eriocheir TaxID=1081669 RepID=A0A1X0QCW6_9MICR|nr:hypothetical protein HERIO_512 [Hepatospora eriocheir]
MYIIQNVDRFVRVEITITTRIYKQIIAQKNNTSARKMGLVEYIFKHDNDLKHTSSYIANCINEKTLIHKFALLESRSSSN